jgi:pyruvate dehydrogenase E1 component beta subunit
MSEVIMPKMGDSMEVGKLLSWRKHNGEQVKSGEVIAEIETDKSNVEIEAEEDGVLQTSIDEGVEVPVGATIATIGGAPSANGTSNGQASSNGQSPTIQDKPEVEHVTAPVVVEAAAVVPEPTKKWGPTVKIKYSEAIRMALEEELERDTNVYMLGEEIGQYQGTFKITENFLEKYGPERIVDTPISETGMVGMTIGSAMLGLRPILEFMTFNFALVAWDQIINHAAKILYMSGGQFSVPCVLRGPGGVGTQLSAQHSQDLTHWYANTPGLKVVAPATPADAKGLLKAAVRDNNPVIFMEHAKLYGIRGDVPEDPDFIVPIGVADIKRAGRDCTIVTYSRGVVLSLAAADELAKEGIDVEVIDLRSLQPFDIDTVIKSVQKTHHAVVVQEQWEAYGIAAEFSAQIMEKAFDYLDAPVVRVAGAFVPMPYAKALEDIATPHEGDIIMAVKQTLERSS